MRIQHAFLLVFLVLSGFAALIFEICWIRKAALVFGVTTFAVSSVLAVFFLGLTLGSYAFGQISHRTRYPLRVYCRVELGLVACGLMSPMVFQLADAAYRWCYCQIDSWPSAPILGGLSVMLLALLAPTVLMGASLPLFCRQFVLRRDGITQSVGLLYALNTLGAAAGCAVTGLFLIPQLGVDLSIQVGVAVSLLSALGVAAFGWNATSPAHTRSPQRSTSTPPSTAIVPVLFFGTGFVALGTEVLWIRYLSLLVHNTVYTYSLTLTVVLLGIVAGSLLAALIARRVESPVVLFGGTQVLIGISNAVVMLIPPRVWNVFGQADLWICLALLFLPATLAGAAFPLAVRLVVDDPAHVSKSVGRMAAVNTLGGITGALSVGFILLPITGLQTSLLVTTGISVAVGVTAWVFGLRLASWQTILAVTLAPVAWLGIHALSSTRIPEDFLATSGELVDYREGRSSNVAVIRTPEALRLEIDRWWQGEDRINHQIVAAHLPMLLHPQAQRVLVVGAGTGQTASRFLLYDAKRLDCVDIEPAVFDIVRQHFASEWMADARVHLVRADGRALLAHGEAKYDVISLELGQISRPGVASFYTAEFYQRARRRLNTDGLLCQFVPTPFFTTDEFRSVVGTFCDVFPQSSLWYNTSELLLIGSNGDRSAIDLDHLRDSLSAPRVHADLQYSQWGGPAQWLNKWPVMLGSFLAGPPQLDRMTAGFQRYHDDLPLLEYATSGRELGTTDEVPIVRLLRGFLSPVQSICRGKLEAQTLSEIDSLREKNLGDMVAVAALRHVDHLKAAEDYAAVVAELAEPLRLNPDHAKAHRVTADAYMLLGRLPEAHEHYARSIAVSPQSEPAHRGLGFCLHRMSRISEAIPHYEAALKLQPRNAEVHNNLGAALAAEGELQRAISHFREALRVDPDYADARRNLNRAERAMK